MSDDPRYPIGKFQFPVTVSAAERAGFIDRIQSTPARLRAAISGLSPAQLATPYRDGGWTVAQVIHHIPESHMNSYIRFKLALTEDTPVIKPYDESAWAKLPDVEATPPEVSLTLLESLHARWVMLLKGLSEAEWQKEFRHPEIGVVKLCQNLALYAWHGDHHIGHITGLRARKGW